MSHVKKTILRDLLSRLDGVSNTDGSYSFLVRAVNSPHNKSIVERDLAELTRVFKLPSPAKREKIKKFTSSMLIHMAKQCDCSIGKCTKYYVVRRGGGGGGGGGGGDGRGADSLGERDSYESTSGYYELFGLEK